MMVQTKDTKKGRAGGGAPPSFVIREADSPTPVPVALHPSSVNARVTSFSSQYLVFAEKVRAYSTDSSSDSASHTHSVWRPSAAALLALS